MGFLDNSGDIILDAVLTDAGRARLSRGDCSFRIAKFALGDDEISYALYNKTHPSGSQYYDLEILQSPVLEAFTNNTSTMNSKLISIPRNNVYYLPVVKLWESGNTSMHPNLDTFVVAVDGATVDRFKFAVYADAHGASVSPLLGTGLLNGFQPGASPNGVALDQGLDNEDVPPSLAIPIDLSETAYMIEYDARLCEIYTPNMSTGPATPIQTTFIDDDQIANSLVQMPFAGVISALGTSGFGGAPPDDSSIAGSRGTRLQFRIKASTSLQTVTNLFERMGRQIASGENISNNTGTTLSTYWAIDSTVRVTGVNTGYRVDIPVKFVKYYTT